VIELTRGEAVKNGVSVRTELTGALPLIEGDRVELQQVILNLIINAIEAMSGTSDGSRELIISTGKAESGGVLVAVRDSGPGLAPATLEHIFGRLLHDEAQQHGHGLIDQPFDHQSARRTIMGRGERAPRGDFSVHACPCRKLNPVGMS